MGGDSDAHGWTKFIHELYKIQEHVENRFILKLKNGECWARDAI